MKNGNLILIGFFAVCVHITAFICILGYTLNIERFVSNSLLLLFLYLYKFTRFHLCLSYRLPSQSVLIPSLWIYRYTIKCLFYTTSHCSNRTHFTYSFFHSAFWVQPHILLSRSFAVIAFLLLFLSLYL